MNLQILLSLLLLVGISASANAAEATASSAGAEAYFISPKNGAHLTGKFTVRFGLTGMGVAPAGVATPNTGHHHLLVNAVPMPDLSLPLPSSDAVRHFGKGQTETVLDLAPGKYTLQLLLGDHLHRPHQPPVMSGTLTVTVDE